jgi:hypothetical protein
MRENTTIPEKFYKNILREVAEGEVGDSACKSAIEDWHGFKIAKGCSSILY